jgi:hypothetical protein
MTKLMEWLVVGFLIISSWLTVLMSQPNLANTYWYYKWFPVILIILFGIYAVFTVLYRVLTFNECKSASIELQNVSIIIMLNISISRIINIIDYNHIFLSTNFSKLKKQGQILRVKVYVLKKSYDNYFLEH